MKKADEKVVVTSIWIFAAGIILLTAVLFAANVIARPVDLSDCAAPPATVEYQIDKFENEGTLLAEGWAIDTKNSYNTVSVTAVVKDRVTGEFYILPTATRSADKLHTPAAVPEDKEEFAGFFARGIILGGSGSYELCLVFDGGSARYLINTGVSA